MIQKRPADACEAHFSFAMALLSSSLALLGGAGVVGVVVMVMNISLVACGVDKAR